MAEIITVALPADLPENWAIGETVAPEGADVGLSQQHGYNYLMEQVNNAQTAATELETNLEGANAQLEALSEQMQNAGSFELMETSIPLEDRRPRTLYGLILQNYGGEDI